MTWKSNPLLVICLFALTISLNDAQDQSDETTHIYYVMDENYIDTGINENVAGDHINNSIPRHLWTVRSFPNGTRNCYNLSPPQRMGARYLIRATFMYGNYDGLNHTTKFDLYLGVDLWDAVEVNDSASVVVKELIHVPSSDYLYVCLINRGAGTPFISALELRPLAQDIYPADNPGDSLLCFSRWNFAPADVNGKIRYPDDIYDRIWQPKTMPDLTGLYTTLNMTRTDKYFPPQPVMKTAITPLNASQSVDFEWKSPDPNVQFYVYMHFAEVEILQSNESRAFYVHLDDEIWSDSDTNQPFVPRYLQVMSMEPLIGKNKARFNYSIVKAENSTLPPIINALEVYSEVRFVHSQTDDNDVRAMVNIKSRYKVNKNWQGDPCMPKEFRWDGLDCLENTSIPPRITSLNLSWSGLTGNVPSDVSNLNFLENLDLSNNALNGVVPEFLAELPQLKFLNLSGNKFTGSIPQKLLDKASSGLQLRADGYDSYACEGDQCNSKKSKKFVVPLVVSLTLILSLVVLASLIVTLKKRRTKRSVIKLGANRKDSFLEPKSMQFSYRDILKMTNDFERILGKGGFGTVYHGLTGDGKQVAVKLLSPSSTQGYYEFQREAELLTRVHHRNLTSLVGYCYEDGHMALVYEFMAKGNLKEHLSGSNGNVLSWSERLQILLDAAQGLDYLHNGCKPPIVHRDVKSTNILLTKNFEAKLADFGLSRAFAVDDVSSVSTRVVGTLGYLDPEYYETNRLHEKSDVYSLGVVMLEVITGRPAIVGMVEKRNIVQWVTYLVATGDIASIVDPKLKRMYDVNSAWKALEVAMACTSYSSAKRPTMAQVITELKDCLDAQKVCSEGQDTHQSFLLEVNPQILEIEIGPR
ncbi:OLC1v1027137C6 [Oldenlandia corymbosa var. corymbosa]|uniref:non-specific serine/threonine protein kinase n=1 Tax=Oldenlandia corymbosa var. corymbosa TaxID=529605 RepID=A0AAV1CAK2_OLDCO|nr:OLC1v1027137C6 [Oldenlandia corymbosa var. corymbosa]